MKPTMTIVNLAEFQGQLKKLDSAARGDALGRAAMAGGFVIESYAKINANEQFSAQATNTLAGSIQTVLDKASANHAEVSVGPSVVYGRIMELGGWIRPVNAKFLDAPVNHRRPDAYLCMVSTRLVKHGLNRSSKVVCCLC